MSRPGPLFVAIDTQEVDRARALIAAVGTHAGGVKLGLEYFVARGPEGVRAVMQPDVPLFLDLKFHDIPNTVAGAVRSALALRPAFMTIHAAGGRTMMRAAADAARGSGCRLLAVTVLTSLDDADLASVGQSGPSLDQVRRLAALARESGADGIVCAPSEVAAIRAEVGPDFTLMVPGIRPVWAAAGDQKRAMPPKEAVAAGADHIVVGRPITGAADPAEAARRIMAEIEG
ncbi:MAG TPA: orotidine-5'-phosphate decarboxylase [Alphaproteobacteria bacterium]|nr:orotidine-5'-phosphate decarboxylase [Alphaproteobacteria bacterium]